MPRDGLNQYHRPPGTDAVTNYTIESTKYNAYVADVEQDLNLPRPIVAGGTGAASADAALVALGGEKAKQVVTNYDTQPWVSGSFYSAAGATSAPNPTNRFAGIYYANADDSYATVEARDQTTGIRYVRNKVAGVWGAWAQGAGTTAELDAAYVNVAGDTMTGPLVFNFSDPTTYMTKAASGNVAQTYINTGANARWLVRFSDNDPESGGNAGSSFRIFRANDAGTIIDAPLSINRSNGVVSFNVPPAGVPDVRYDIAQSLTSAQQAQARQNIAVPAANVVINGDFRINQIGYASGAVLGAGVYGHDQWKAGASGGDYAFTQLKSSTQITIAAGKSIIQPIEDALVVGGSYVLSWTGTAQARAGINTLVPSGAYAASPLLITGQTAGTVMSVEFNTGTLGTVKLEVGALATPFIMRPYDQELLTCKRYWQQVYAGIDFAYIAGGSSIGAQGLTFVPQMRASPSVVGVPTTIGNVASITLTSQLSPVGVNMNSSATTTGRCYWYGVVTADARL